MTITSLKMDGVRSFLRTDVLNFSKSINLLIGANNSGKTTLLNVLHSLQGEHLSGNDVRMNSPFANIEIWFDGQDLNRVRDNAGQLVKFGNQSGEVDKKIEIRINPNGHIQKLLCPHGSNTQRGVFRNFSPREGENLIIPFLSKRKVLSYSEKIDYDTVPQVTGNFLYLFSKIDRISSPDFQPANKEYRDACQRIFGYPISTVASKEGKVAAFIIRNQKHIPVSAMGEGIINILGLIVELCLAENQFFLIEELENDIHPKALKELLEIVIEKSKTNQFFISTHSNIVTKMLGTAQDAKIFQLNMEFERDESRVPNSRIIEIKNDPESRRKVLEDLGYEFTDYDLYEGWLFFEESSAEEIVREYLIQWFFNRSKLRKYRTFSARSLTEIETKFEDFNRMFVYLHLTQVYKNKAWVIVDNGDEEKKVIEKMKEYYLRTGWDESNFLQFSKHDFEEYYPQMFKAQVEEIKKASKDKKRKLKQDLLQEVKKWILDNPDLAKKEFEKSAKDVIEVLKEIESKI